MTVHGLRVRVVGGQGLVVAGPVAALFVDDDGANPGAHEFVSALVDTVTAALAPADDPGPALVREIGGLVTGVMSRGAVVSPFALVAETAGGVAVMIVGPVTVRYTGAEGASEQLSGRNAATWVDRIFHGAPASVVVSSDAVSSDPGSVVPSHPLADLGHGAVGGGGFELLPHDTAVAGPDRRGAHAAPEDAQDHRPRPGPVRDEPGPALAPEPEPEPQFQWEPVAGPVDSGPAEVGAVGVGTGEASPWTPGGTPEPVAAPEPVAESPWSQPVPVAAEPPAPEPEPEPVPEPESEPEPPPPVLHRADGSTLEVGRLVVLGREPQISPLVVSGDAEAVTLDDEARVTSRVHASIVAEADSLTVTDLGSANGTWVLHAGDSDWTELTANEPTALRTGGRIRIGSEEFVFAPPFS